MKPYYQDDWVTVYNCGNSEFLPSVPAKFFGLCLTDPPYGIGMSQGGGGGRRKDHVKVADWDSEIPQPEIFGQIRRVSKHQIIWGGNYFTENLPPSMGWLVWDKGQRKFSLADGELAWTSFQRALRIMTYSRSKANLDGKIHPTQKSLSVMKWCIDYAVKNSGQEIKSIIDPFGGSLTTALACKQLNIKCVILEREEKYCELGINRLLQEVFDFGLCEDF
jgi:site-specific DNA-methyltransferase (adenine-specific)